MKTPYASRTRRLQLASILALTSLVATAAVPTPATRVGDYRTAQSGAFTTASTWEVFVAGPSATAADGHFTPAADFPTNTAGTITIRATHAVTLDVAAILDEVIIEQGATFEHSGTANLTLSNSAAPYELIVQGIYRELSVTGRLAPLLGAQIIVDETGIWQHSANGGSLPTAEWSSSSLLLFDGITDALSLSSTAKLGQVFGRITWNCLTQTSVFAFGPLGTESINVATVATGDMRVMSTGTGTLQLATSARRSNVIYLSAGYEQFGGRVTVNARANGPRTVDVANDFVLRGGTFAVSSASLSLFPSATGGLRIAGDLNLRGGILNITETPAPGSISVTGGVALAEGATLRASGTGTATFNFAQGPTRLYSNLGTVAGPILFSVNGGSTVDFGIYALFGTGTFTLSDGGVAKIGSPDGITAVGAPDAQLGNIRVGTVSPFQRTYSPLATYLYTGTQSQRTGSGLPLEIGTTSATLNAGVLGISTSSAANSVTLSRPARLHGELMLELGQLISSPMAMLTLSTSAVLNPTFPGSADSHVEGVMAREMDETKALYEYPIGDNGDYRPLALRLTNPLGTATYQVEARREPAPNSTSLSSQGSTNVAELLGDTHWLVARAVGTTTAILRIPYDPAITPDLNLLTIAGYNTLTARWENLGLIARNQTDNWVEAEFPTQYSMAMLARAGVDPLPVELIRFAATRRASTVELTWATASEQNSAWFVIERSANGTEFADQARVAAAGNSAKELRYAATDANPLAPTSYYRLRQIDQDGRFTHSDIVAVRGGAGPATALSLYPNPAIDVLTVQLPAAAAGTTVRVVNALGQVVLTRTVEAAASQCVLNIATLPRGSYRVTVLAPGQPTVSQRLVKAAE